MPPLLGYDAAATIPIKFDVSGEVNLYRNDAVPKFREKSQKLAPCHQFAGGLEDDAEAEVAFVAFDFDAEEVGNGRIFSTQRKYT